jgi:hypothetical protein
MANKRLHGIDMRIVSIKLLLKVNIELSDSMKGIIKAETIILIVMNLNTIFAILTNILTSDSSVRPTLFGDCNPDSNVKKLDYILKDNIEI